MSFTAVRGDSLSLVMVILLASSSQSFLPFHCLLAPLGRVPLNCCTPSTSTRIHASRVVVILTATCDAGADVGLGGVAVVGVGRGPGGRATATVGVLKAPVPGAAAIWE